MTSRSILKLLPLTAICSFGATFCVAIPAHAIDRVDCGQRSDYTKVVSDVSTCWANAGSTVVELYNVTAVEGGNNAGRVFFPNGKYLSSYEFRKWSRTETPGPLGASTIKVVKITID